MDSNRDSSKGSNMDCIGAAAIVNVFVVFIIHFIFAINMLVIFVVFAAAAAKFIIRINRSNFIVSVDVIVDFSIAVSFKIYIRCTIFQHEEEPYW